MPLPGHKGLEGSDAENISLVDWKPCAWRNPMCAAQSHYSFFQHYRAGSLEVRGRRGHSPPPRARAACATGVSRGRLRVHRRARG